MSSEPERPIEKLLRASARQRREQGGEHWEMHPATRRNLQNEVAARFGRKTKRSGSRPVWLLFQGWLKPLAALGVLACVSIAIWVSVHSGVANKREQLLAKNEPAQNAPAASQISAPTAANKVELPRSEMEERAAVAKSLGTADNTPKSGPPSPLEETELAKQPALLVERSITPQVAGNPPGTMAQVPASNPGLTKDNQAASADRAFRARYGLSSPQPAAGTAPSALPAVAAAGSITPPASDQLTALAVPVAASAGASLANFSAVVANNGFSTGLVQYGRFAASQNTVGPMFSGRAASRLSAAPMKKEIQNAKANQILVSFRVEQSGQDLRIIDNDGSVYSGPVQGTGPRLSPAGQEQAQTSGTPAALTRSALIVASRDSQTTQQPPVQLFFKVSGTNHSSNQQVVFSGALNADTNLLQAVAANPDQSSNRGISFDKLSISPAPKQLTNMRLSGKAVIGGTEEVGIEAVPVSP